GEITPAYAILPTSSLQVIHEYYPQLRLLYILRNPIDRAWSQARMELAKRLQKSGPMTKQDESRWLKQQLSSEQSVARGDYAACLERWWKWYPPEFIKIFIYDEFFATPRAGICECCVFLGGDAKYYHTMTDQTLATVVLPETELLGLDRAPLPPHSTPPHINMLLDIYAPKIAILEGLLGRKLSDLWLARYIQ
ncbi:MAG: sulfotransferase domain-containing protein, partial [Nitrosopumilaceae archaeon]